MQAKKDDKKDGKISRRFIHSRTLDECGLALEAGKIKYGDYNFMLGHSASQLIDAMHRHLERLQWGEEYDEDCSERLGRKVHHLGCVLAGANMYLAQLEEGTLRDDRFDREEVFGDTNKAE